MSMLKMFSFLFVAMLMLAVSAPAMAGDCGVPVQRVRVVRVQQVYEVQPQVQFQRVQQVYEVPAQRVQFKQFQSFNQGGYSQNFSGGGYGSRFQNNQFQSGRVQRFGQGGGGNVIRNLLPIAGAVGGAALGGPLGAGLGAAVGGILGGGR